VLRRHIAEALIHRRSSVGAQGDFEARTGERTETRAF
jgi:magnesium chelatase family protein